MAELKQWSGKQIEQLGIGQHIVENDGIITP